VTGKTVKSKCLIKLWTVLLDYNSALISSPILNGFKSNKEIKHLIRMINIKNKIFQQNMSLKKFGLTIIYGRNIIKRKTV